MDCTDCHNEIKNDDIHLKGSSSPPVYYPFSLYGSICLVVQPGTALMTLKANMLYVRLPGEQSERSLCRENRGSRQERGCQNAGNPS